MGEWTGKTLEPVDGVEGFHVAEQTTTIHAVGSPGRSRMGDAAEAAFVARACILDFRVAKPWGNLDPYDLLVGMGRGFWRVQVKCTEYRRRGRRSSYGVKVCTTRGTYSKDEIDFIAAHVVPEDVWYIIPVEAFSQVDRLYLNPRVGDLSRNHRAKYEKYREAWCLLACPPKARGWKDIPVLCRCRELPVRCAVCPMAGSER